ncbi:hypothetical protein [Citricoccus sp.]|uniref:hypothetical protein n=1 Tax=Citricoccus sp. TaxID=1978372 RepID=UPI002BF412AF|nr:hypothetical protein [Citricoccus sp.]HRO95077.1 hypothetical protein [Citricoccus sp.]
MELLDQLGGVGTLAPGAALVLVLVLLYRQLTSGALVTESVHKELRADRDYWREAHEIERQRMDEIRTQVAAILEVSTTTMRYAEAVQRVAESSDSK